MKFLVEDTRELIEFMGDIAVIGDYTDVGAPSWNISYGNRELNPSEGWKLHISGTPETAEAIAGRILPELRTIGVWHKILKSTEKLAEQNSSEQAGKFIVVYPTSASDAFSIIDKIGGSIADFECPAVTTERQVVNNIYTRYGSFLSTKIATPFKDGSGDIITVEDNREMLAPIWASSFERMNTSEFMSYNARRDVSSQDFTRLLGDSIFWRDDFERDSGFKTLLMEAIEIKQGMSKATPVPIDSEGRFVID